MTTSTALCACCGKPLADGSTVCHTDALSLAGRLREAAGHAEDAWTVIARQTRMGTAGGARRPEPEPAVAAEDPRRNSVTAFGWQASIERPPTGALRSGEIPPDLSASATLADVGNVVTTWARHVCETRGTELPARRPLLGPVCEGGECSHGSCADVRRRLPPSALGEALAWLATQVDWLRKRPEATEAFDELGDACGRLARLVDSPPVKGLVGRCDCGRFLYAADGRTVVQCPEKTCQLRWEVAESRAILRRAIDDRLFTAAEAARLAVRLDDGGRSTEQVRKLIGKWHERGQVAAHGHVVVQLEGLGKDGKPKAPRHDPLFRFGDVADRLAATPRRQPAGAAA